eukprot:scaffold159918_cov26-Prasinocladus_malaysianus.AAC.1
MQDKKTSTKDWLTLDQPGFDGGVGVPWGSSSVPGSLGPALACVTCHKTLWVASTTSSGGRETCGHKMIMISLISLKPYL